MANSKIADSNGAAAPPGMGADGLSRTDVTQVGGVSGMDTIDPKGSDDHHTRLVTEDLISVGGEKLNDDPPQVDVAGPLKQELGEPTSTWTPGRGDSLGQHDPVTNKGLDMYNSSTNGIQHTALMLTGDPTSPVTNEGKSDVDVAAELKQEVGGPTSTWGSDDFHITDPVTDQHFPTDGVSDSERARHHPSEKAPMEELQSGQSDPTGDPAQHHDSEKDSLEGLQGGSTATSSVDIRTHLLNSMKLAEVEQQLGIIKLADKFNRAAELERESPAQLIARLDSYHRVRQAGLRRPMPQRQAAAIPAMPSLNEATVHEASYADDTFDQDAASLFM